MRRGPDDGEADTSADEHIEIDPSELSGGFAVPQWLRGLGQTSWLLVGMALLIVAIIWLLSLTYVIVLPVLTAGIVAAVASPLVAWLATHGVSRGIGSGLLMVALIALGVGVVLVVVGGITGETGDATARLAGAKDTIAGWLTDLGVDPSRSAEATQDASSATDDTVSALLNGVAGGLSKLSSAVFFFAMTALSLIFLLKDGPTIGAWFEDHSGVPKPVAQTISRGELAGLVPWRSARQRWCP